MPITRSDLSHDEHADISVQILSRQPASGSKRAYWFDTEDVEGNKIPVLVWERHRELAEHISTGEKARLRNFKVKSWPKQETQLHTVSSSSVEPVERRKTRILHVSDSHLGYHLRPTSGGKIMLWHDEVDCRARFRDVIVAAFENDVDAVVHTGDVFDHTVCNEDLDLLEYGVKMLDSEGIPFFYVLGNHDREKGRARLRKLSDAGLAYPLEEALQGQSIGDVTLYGLDKRDANWWRNPDIRFTPNDTRYSVLCLHQTVSPPYSKDNPDCTLDTILKSVASRLSPDLLLLGDLHGPFSDSDASVPVYYSGPTARISYQYEDADPRANLFEFDGKPHHTTIPL
jgi:DNA repair exonuclease SbcCD nuclease subunit